MNNSKPLCIGGVQDILYAPETQLTCGLTASGPTTKPRLDIPGSHWLPKSNLSNSGANYTNGASASPLSRCFVATILLHMLPSWTGMLFREAGRLPSFVHVASFPAFSIHNPWGCPEKCLSATFGQGRHFLCAVMSFRTSQHTMGLLASCRQGSAWVG
mgnify:CR=1 FL=1